MIAQNWFLEAVRRERGQQDAKWGQQTHDGPAWLGVLMEEVGELARGINENAPAGDITIELVQIAAVCCAAHEQHVSRKRLTAHWGSFESGPGVEPDVA